MLNKLWERALTSAFPLRQPQKMINDKDLGAEILSVLEKAKTGKGSEPGFQTSYQILLGLPEPLRQELIAQYGTPGKGAKTPYAAASRVATKLDAMRGDVEKAYFDPTGVTFDVGDGEHRQAGYEFVAIYRRRPTT